MITFDSDIEDKNKDNIKNMQDHIIHYDFIFKQCKRQKEQGGKFIIDNLTTHKDHVQGIQNALIKMEGIHKVYHGKIKYGVINSMSNGIGGYFITNSDSAALNVKTGSRTTTSYSSMVNDAMEKGRDE